jgi:hypothetical protein
MNFRDFRLTWLVSGPIKMALWVIFLGMYLVSSGTPAYAWNEHQKLMPMLLSEVSDPLSSILSRSVVAPCEAEDQQEFTRLAKEFYLNPEGKIPPTSLQKCGKGTQASAQISVQMSVANILNGGSVDDPDRGMDQNLPSTDAALYDPQQDQKWMGGTVGTTSQGFRHMYFGGWKGSSPLLTFQIPLRPVGRAPERIYLFSQKAREYIRAGKVAWGTRLTAWALHYIQDLTQPFHTVQVLDLRMVPWSALWIWPPGGAFNNLVRETTRVMTNFHWTYEDYVLNRVELENASPFRDCLASPEKYSGLTKSLQVPGDSKTSFPQVLTQKILAASLELAPRVGAAEVRMFGDRVMLPGVDLIQTPQLINYSEYATAPAFKEARTELEKVTCAALANASLASRKLIEWTFSSHD